MISESEAREIVKQFAAQRNYPEGEQGKPALTALRKAVERWCKSADHGRRVAERIVEDSEFCPTPAQIRDVADRIPAASEQAARTCERCRATWGWLYVRDGHYTGVVRCDHREAAPPVTTWHDGVG